MYHLYHTSAYVLGGINISEGSRLLSLFTRELGLVRAHARSIREERSKLRGFLQSLSFAEVALVRGRDLWRITTAGIAPVKIPALADWPQRRAAARIAHFLERLLAGEERDAGLFDDFSAAMRFLAMCKDDMIATWELFALARILSRLGYGSLCVLDGSFSEEGWSDNLFSRAEMKQGELFSFVNRAIAASQL